MSKEKVFECKHCNFYAKTKGGLTLHTKAKHPVKDGKVAGTGKDMNPKKTKQTKRQYARHWDVVAALKDYISDQTLSLKDIAEKYNVSVKTVELEAAKHGWANVRQKVIESGLKQFEAEQAKNIKITIDRHLQLYRSMQTFGSNTLVRIMNEANAGQVKKIPNTKEAHAAIKALKIGIDGERTAMGLPTLIQKSADKDDSDSPYVADLTSAIQRAKEILRDAGEEIED